jgi:hypothetical protein
MSFKYFTLTGSFERNEIYGDSYSVSISGGVDQNGFSSKPLKNSGVVILASCNDLNMNGACEDGEPDFDGEMYVKRGNVKKQLPAYFNDNSLYAENRYEVEPGFSVTSDYANIGIDKLIRGQRNDLRIPAQMVVEREGHLKSGENGVTVEAVDPESGLVLGTQKTSFGGWYLFYLPEQQGFIVREKEVA